MRNLILALLLAGAFQTAPAVLIDDFSTEQGPVAGQDWVSGGGILGGTRIVTVGITGGQFTASGGVASFGWSDQPEDGDTGWLTLAYQGGGPLQAWGIGDVDLTDGGASDRFLIDILASSGTFDLSILVATSFGDQSQFDGVGTISGGFSGTLSIPFAALSTFAGSGADLSAANAINLGFSGLDGSQTLTFDNFRTGAAPGGAGGPVIPEPSTYLLFGAGLAAVAFARRRRDGSR